MARYTVQMTFEALALREPIDKSIRLHGWAAALQLLGDDGMLAVSASKVVADSPSDAASLVTAAVMREWSKNQGPLKMLTWTAHRDRALVGGRSRAQGFGRGWDWDLFTWHPDDGDDGDDPGGSAGVREPRRPKPGPPSLHLAVDPPAEEAQLALEEPGQDVV
jgi:hypothetical protein